METSGIEILFILTYILYHVCTHIRGNITYQNVGYVTCGKYFSMKMFCKQVPTIFGPGDGTHISWLGYMLMETSAIQISDLYHILDVISIQYAATVFTQHALHHSSFYSFRFRFRNVL